MKFVYPEFLWALFAVAIPIIIHLFNFRRFKKIYFSNVRFLQEVKQETQSKSQLKHLLVLLMRMLAVAAIVCAFAMPYTPGDGTTTAGDKAVSIYLDNSYSMNGESTDGRLFEVARNRIASLVKDNYRSTDRFQLLTNDFEGKHQRLVNRDEFQRLLAETELSPTTRRLSEVYARQQDALAQSEAVVRHAFVFSDFQKTVTDLEQLEADTNVSVYLQPIQPEEVQNLYVDSLWFSTPVRQLNQQEELHVRIVNTSDEAYENVPLKLDINGAQKSPGSFSVAGNSSVDTVLFFTNTETGIQHGTVSITDYPLTFDDDYFFSFEVANEIPVLVIQPDAADTSARYFRSMFASDPFFRFRVVNERNIDYSALPTNDLIILSELPDISSGLNQELTRFVDNGGSVIVFPAEDLNRQGYNSFLTGMRANKYLLTDTTTRKVASINLEHPIYHDVFEIVPQNIDLPVAQMHFQMEQNLRTNTEDLLRLQNGDPFFSVNRFGKGKLYTSAVGLQESFGNFTRHAVFVTTILRAAELSVSTSPLYYTIGRDESAELFNISATGEQTFRLSHSASNYEVIPEHRNFGGKTNIFFRNQIRQAGNYELNLADQEVAGFGFNFSRDESEPAVYSSEELANELARLGLTRFNLIADTNGAGTIAIDRLHERHYWKYCIWMVLIFLALEVILLKLWKR